MKIVLYKMFDISLIFAQNMDCGYMLEPPAFRSKIKKNRHTPAIPKWGFSGYACMNILRKRLRMPYQT